MSAKKRPGGALQDLLAQFGSRNSATSATKARRISSPINTGQQSQPVTPTKVFSNPPLQPPYQQTFDFTLSDWVANDSATSSSTPKTPQKFQAQEDIETSEDELVRSNRKPRTFDFDELKMERRRNDRSDRPRRSARGGNDNILQSDTIRQAARISDRSKKRSVPFKLDTTRTRLRNEIAQKSKAKANNFLVANKDCFLPLLPENNYISRLLTQHEAQPIVPYQELTEQPRGVTATMKPYQLTGLSFLVHLYNNGFSGLLGDEMGLGKTLQTLSLFQYLEEYDHDHGITSEELRPYLVVCPLSVLNSWVSEAQRWVPDLKVLRFHGSQNERDRLKRVAMGMEDRYGNETIESKDRKAFRKAGLAVSKLPTEEKSNSYKIIITTYETYQAEQTWFKHSFVWRYVVLDEGHKIKSNATQISSALKNITAEYRLILTGTPLQNNLVEMWSLLSWLYPDVFIKNTETLFKESFDLNQGKVNRQTMDDARHLLELIMLRRMKNSPQVNLGLPPKEEVLLYVPLTPMQRFWYTRLLTRVDNAMLNELFADGKSKEKAALENDKQENALLNRMTELEQDDAKQDEWVETAKIMRQTMEKEQANTAVQSAWRKLMNLVMQLRKCCSHPYLLPGVAPDPYYLGEHIIRSSGKFILLEKLLRNSVLKQGKKVLIFSGFTRTLDCCEDLLTLIGNRGHGFNYLRFDGNTGRARRNLDIRLFNDLKSDYKVMLLSTRTGGLGINLTTAEDIIFLDEDWNPQITLQAEARAHRIGQTKKVTIYKLCTQGTVEEQMMGRIRKKLYLSAKITESMQSVHGAKSAVKKGQKGRTSIPEDMPQMDTSQLKTLVRRGAQTLSHPEIDVTEMVSWDLETMMQKCRDKPADPQANTETPSSMDADEEKWLSAMERVECAVFDGKRYQRQIDTKAKTSAGNILPESVTREDRRKGKNITVEIDGFSISKESLNCADWEAVPTFAGKDPQLADPKREKAPEILHEGHCLACFDDTDSGHVIECKSCPRVYHFDCLEPKHQVKVKGFSGFFCSQHSCEDCGKNTTDAGGLLFRCRWCPRAHCEDCLDWDKAELVGEVPPEFEMLGEGPSSSAFYIVCPTCIQYAEEDEERKKWMEGSTIDYNEQHSAWLNQKQDTQVVVEGDQDAQKTKTAEFIPQVDGANDMFDFFATIYDEGDISLPALTDASAFASATSLSRVSTPQLSDEFQVVNCRKRLDIEMEEGPFGPSAEKEARLGPFY